ncbi:MAG: hypothetical protein ACI4IW_06575 [Oscillospiraceae bacterium]
MKKIIALLLALIMVLSFAACSKDEPVSDNSANENSQSEVSSSEEQSEEEPEEKLDHIRGSVDGLVYTNSAAEITFTAPEGWTYYTDEQIAALYNLSSEELLPEETAEILENTDIVYDMYCQNLTTGASVNINFENLGILYGTILDEKSYLELSKTSLGSTLSGSGMELTSCEVVTATVNGKEVSCLDIVINMTDYDIDLYEKIFVKKVGSFMSCITIGALTTEEIDEIAAGLSF